MELIIIACIIALIFLGHTFIEKYFDYKNPYIDEEIDKISVWTRKNEESPQYFEYRYKRTYKNGKVIYFTRKE